MIPLYLEIYISNPKAHGEPTNVSTPGNKSKLICRLCDGRRDRQKLFRVPQSECSHSPISEVPRVDFSKKPITHKSPGRQAGQNTSQAAQTQPDRDSAGCSGAAAGPESRVEARAVGLPHTGWSGPRSAMGPEAAVGEVHSDNLQTSQVLMQINEIINVRATCKP